MKKYTFLFLLFNTIISCNQKDKNKIVYKDKTKEAIFYKNKEIKNSSAREIFRNGLENVEIENYIKAKEYFIKADKIESNNPIILNAIAETESRLGDDIKSNKILRHVLSIDSTYLPTYINLGRNYCHNKQYEKARDTYLNGTKYISNKNLHTKSTLYLNLSIVYNRLKDCQNAIKYSNEALKYSQDEVLSKYANKVILKSTKMCLQKE